MLANAQGLHERPVITWLHELGHQLHYAAGMPSAPTTACLTQYARTNDFEWHAEHFAAWLLNRKALAEWNGSVAEYFDRMVEKLTR
ncbi:hypothetical protein D3C81_2155950 [compost metagenome]